MSRLLCVLTKGKETENDPVIYISGKLGKRGGT